MMAQSDLGRHIMQQAPSPARSFRFGLFEADVRHKTLTRNGVRTKIQDQPFRVLLLLLERPGEIVSREELRQSLWPDGTFVDFDGSLNVILKKLRAAIDDDSDNPRFIETVPRRGYRFIAPVTTIRTEPPTPISLVQPVAPQVDSSSLSQPMQRGPAGRRLVYSAASLALICGSIAAWTHFNGTRSTASASTTAPQPATVQLRRSVAVLGFRNLSEIEGDSWLGTALGEMLSTELASGEKLRLVSSEDVANLRAYSPWAKTDTLDQATTSRIGTALSSNLLVLGSYAIIGKSEHGQLRVDVRLQDCKSGEVITEIAEIGATEDLFGIVSRIGSKLRNRLGIPHTFESDEMTAQASLPANPEAARFYSLGLQKLRAYEFDVARGFFEQAIAADPKFPLAHSMLSRTDMYLGHFDRAKVEAKHGLDLASGLPRTQRMEIEASYEQARADRGKAAEIYRVLFNMFPDSLDYGLQLSKLQLDSYHPDEASETIRQLRQLPSPVRDDPLIDLREASIVMRKSLGDAEKLFRSAAQKALANDKRQVYAKAQQSLCLLNRQHLQSPPECHEAYDIFTAAGNRNLAAATLQIMAENQRLTGHETDAIPLYQQAIQMLHEAGDYEGEGVAQNNLSLALENRGQWAQAEDEYRRAQHNFELVNDRVNLAVVTSNIANLEISRGNFQRAEQLYQECLELAKAAKLPMDQYPPLGHTGLLLMKGELADANAEAIGQIASFRSWAGDPWQTANALTTLGDIQRHQGNLDGAEKSYEESAGILKGVNASPANDQVALAQLAIDRGHAQQADRLVRDAIAAFESDKNAGEELGGYLALGRALLAQGKISESKVAIDKAKSLTDLHEFPVLAMPLDLLELRVKAAGAASGNREILHAIERDLRALIQRAHQIGFYTGECEARLALGEVETRLAPPIGTAHLEAFASDALKRGFVLYAEQAGRIKGPRTETVALNRPGH
jgi:DNA-binding winged helix-turn-helix (wHTH) protein/tetratricopeptide (TPR) repeat protein